MCGRHRWFAVLVILPCAIWCTGCGESGLPKSQRADDLPRLRVVSGAELEARVARGERPVLVEFGVNFGCYRCDQMRPEMTRLAREFSDRADVIRVDFNANRQLAAKYGATICPSYVVFDQQQVVVRRSFPTSADLLAADLFSTLSGDDKGRIR